jgi:hypothetical protein
MRQADRFRTDPGAAYTLWQVYTAMAANSNTKGG